MVGQTRAVRNLARRATHTKLGAESNTQRGRGRERGEHEFRGEHCTERTPRRRPVDFRTTGHPEKGSAWRRFLLLGRLGPCLRVAINRSLLSILHYTIMSCHVMSCHVMSCHVMSCHVMSCLVH